MKMNYLCTKACEVCGKTMEGVARNRKLCSECKIARKKAYEEQHTVKYTADKRESEVREKQSGLEIDIREAQKAGMTYGNYMARKEGRIK
ncbi:MAG: hypothetical protein ACI4JC_01240 [Faecalibacterium sp.]